MERQKLGETAAQQIVAMIQERGYSAGDRLPTEVELVEMLGVGRNTVREALRILMSRNLVVIRQGAGTYISEKNGIPDDPLGFAMVEDRQRLTRDLLQVRAMMEPEIAALAAQNANETDIRRLQEILLETEALICERSDYAEKDSLFHAQIAACSHNMVMSNLVPVITDGIQIFANEVQVTEYEQTMISHRAIFEAIRDKRAVDARQAMIYHLMYNENRFLNGKR